MQKDGNGCIKYELVDNIFAIYWVMFSDAAK